MSDAQKTVLVVEDEAPLLLVLGNALQKEGFTVLTAADGKTGLQLALLKHPDMILADLKLPGMSGIDMIREIRKDTWGKKAHVIILTNASDPTTLDEAMAQGTFYYFVKSDSSMSDVVTAVRSQLNRPAA